MMSAQIAGQIISIFAMACNILSYQQKKQSRLIACQLLGGVLFSISFFLLGATIGGLLNLVAAVRAVIFLFADKLNASHPAWLVGFIGCYIAFYVLTFTVFGVEPKPIMLAVEILPVIGMTALSIGFMLADTKKVRCLGLISSPAWLIYNIYYFSVGAIICEAISLISIFVGMLRHDRKTSNNSEEDMELTKNERFYPLVDKLYYIIVISTLTLLAAATTLVIIEPAIAAIAIMLLTDALSLYFLLGSLFGYVELRENCVFIKYGFFMKREIPYEKIRGVELARKFYSDSLISLKHSMEHVNIKYNRFDVTTVSVKENARFIEKILHRCKSDN